MNTILAFACIRESLKEKVVLFSSKEKQTKMTLKLQERFNKAIAIPSTLQYHTFVPNGEGRIIAKVLDFLWIIPNTPKRKR